MKCDDCLNLLEEYVDGELIEREAEQVGAHVMMCVGCAKQLEMLSAEQEIYARYDRELEISPLMWKEIASRTAVDDGASGATSRFSLGGWLAGLFAAPGYGFALPAMAVVVLAVMIGLVFLRTRTTKPSPAQPEIAGKTTPSPVSVAINHDPDIATPVKAPKPLIKATDDASLRSTVAATFRKQSGSSNQLDVIPDGASADIEDKDTASHLAQAQNLLLSIRNIKFSDENDPVDVSYQKAESRRLLNENIVLRRDAEMAGKFPAKSMLGSLEPFLIDIANLPDKASSSDVRQIRERVQKTEIVAELRTY